MIISSAVVDISQILILFAYIFLTGMILFHMRCVLRWARRVSLWAMLAITVSWAAFYAYAIIRRPLEGSEFELEFAVLLSRLAQIPIIFGVGIMIFMIRGSEKTEQNIVDNVLNGEE